MHNNIEVAKQLGTPFAISTEEGQKIFALIDASFKQKCNVTLNFIGVRLVVSTFLNAAIGQLYGKYTTEFIRDHLSIENMTSDDLNILKKVIDRAKEYFKDQSELEDIIKKHFPDGDQS